MDKIRDSILMEIEKDRMDKVTDINTIKETIIHFLEMAFIKNVIIKKDGNNYCWSGKKDLKLYNEKFEGKFYIDLKRFYE
jgi:hypothetical protein